MKFNAGAGLVYDVADASQSGDGLTVSSFTGTGIGSFTVYLSGVAAGFNDAQNYQWAVLSSTDSSVGSISLAGLTLDTSGFGQAYTGIFGLSQAGNTVFVNYGALIPEPASYALLAGVAFLGFTLTRRRRV